MHDDCRNCEKPDGVKCCFNCGRDGEYCDVWHHCGRDCPAWEPVDNAPAVDAVEIVRCKNCALRGDPENCPMCAHRFEIAPNGLEFCYSNNTEDDGFCHKGVKKDATE